MEFRTGSGLAGIRDGGNYVEDVRFVGGEYGVMTRKPSPGWQFTLVDASFEGQRTAAIKTHEAGLTLRLHDLRHSLACFCDVRHGTVQPVIHNRPTRLAKMPRKS